MSQYGQVNKSCDILGCAKMVFWLHTARTGSPGTLQTHPSASEFHDYHSDTPKHPPDIPKAPPRYLQGTQHSNRRQQTPPDTPKHWQVLFEYVWRCLLGHVVVCWHLDFPGDVWGLLRGCLCGVWGVSEWYSWKLEALRRVLGVSGIPVLTVWSHYII